MKKFKHYVKFTHFWPKLEEDALLKHDGIFTTIRHASAFKYYPGGEKVDIKVNDKFLFEARIIRKRGIKNEDITDELAWRDANMTAAKLQNMLARMYQKHGDDYGNLMVVTLRRIKK